MAFFKFPWPGRSEQAHEQSPVRRSRAAQAESVEDMRRRARHRLIGAAVLVGLGVVGFPILFDSQPRPIPVDIPIEMPDRNAVAPLVLPDASPVDAQGVAVAQNMAQPSVPAAPQQEREEIILSAPAVIPAPPQLLPAPQPLPAPAPPAPKPEPAPAPKPMPKPEPVAQPAPPPPAPVAPKAPAVDEAARARALLEGRAAPPAAAPAAPAAAASGRMIVQVGAFADTGKAAEVRRKLESAGLKTYTQVVQTKDGPRTRVRVGPFANRAEADQAAARIKTLGLPSSVLTL